MAKKPTLEQVRLQQSVSALELGKRAGVAHTTILDIEQRNAKPHLATIRKLAAALGVTPQDIAWPGDPFSKLDPDEGQAPE